MGLLHSSRDIWLAIKDLFLAGSLPGSTICVSALILVSLYLLQVYRRSQRTTRIRGPQSPGWVFGFSKTVLNSIATTELYERWAVEYGPVYRVPLALGESRVILWDPKAIAHFFARDTWLYNLTPFNKLTISITAGRGIMWADGESHKRQRKALNLRFSTTEVFGTLTGSAPAVALSPPEQEFENETPTSEKAWDPDSAACYTWQFPCSVTFSVPRSFRRRSFLPVADAASIPSLSPVSFLERLSYDDGADEPTGAQYDLKSGPRCRLRRL
ncbi:hypothetical protein DEU56DRAFT_532928 [Suillus clintonianus]|uniref:uncharacterized protein n=1 Tax=Suillus clintonianus TaxID=1904413 RepID=UPI001B85E394|nr:uncharacterized protein DEU56DRAFT_532928 [Suillus clintonianus]KAG2127111.1 hypothetical protein DEU56DRAFT_532928 [Suillus clintonianus]